MKTKKNKKNSYPLTDEELSDKTTEGTAPPTPSRIRNKKKEEILQFLKMEDLEKELSIAINFIHSFSPSHLSAENQAKLDADLKKIAHYVKNHPVLDLETVLFFSQKLSLAASTIEAIDEFIVTCHENAEYASAASLSMVYCLLEMCSARPWFLRGLCCKALGDNEIALLSFNMVAQLLPEQPYAYLYMGECLWEMEEKQAALEMLEAGKMRLPPEEKEWLRQTDDLIRAII